MGNPQLFGMWKPLFQSIGANKEFMWCHMDRQTIHQKAMSEVEKPRRMERWILYYNNLYTTLYVYIYIYIIFRIVIIIIVVVLLLLLRLVVVVVVVLLYYCGYYYDNHVCKWPKWQLRLQLLGSCVTWRDPIGCLDIRGYWLGFLYILYTYRYID